MEQICNACMRPAEIEVVLELKPMEGRAAPLLALGDVRMSWKLCERCATKLRVDVVADCLRA